MVKPFLIEELFAWLVIEPSGEEGLPGLNGPDGVVMPMIGSDRARIESLRPFAERAAKARGYPFMLVKFTKREILEKHSPTEAAPPEVH